MEERTIVGVDYSGSKSDVPWITTAVLEGTRLVLKSCEDIHREDLIKRLRKLGADAVVALDFPFGVPQQFALELDSNASTMCDLWRVAADDDMEYTRFRKLRDCFVQRQPSGKKDILRVGDIYFEKPLSPLKTDGPNMLPMTFRGMEMLYHLWTTRTPRFCVPPLCDGECDAPTLLETMPGVWLDSFQLPSEKYKKSYKDQGVARTKRKKILYGLSKKTTTGLTLTDFDRIYDTCATHDDGLDSLVAAITAAKWVRDKDKSVFRHPSSARTVANIQATPNRKRRISPGVKDWNEQKAAGLEGWIYAPW